MVTVLMVAGDPGVPPPPYTVRLVDRYGEPLGVITDPPGVWLGGGPAPSAAEIGRLHHLGTLQKILVVDEVAAATGLSPRHVDRVLDEVWDEPFGSTVVRVDGRDVAADTLVHRGLELAFGRDVHRWPFAVFRRAGTATPWPDLVTADA